MLFIGLADLPPLFQAVEWMPNPIHLKFTKINGSPSARAQGGVRPMIYLRQADNTICLPHLDKAWTKSW